MTPAVVTGPAIVLVLLVSLSAAGCASQRPSDPGQGFISGDGVIEQIPADQRDDVAPITGELLDGRSFDSRDLAGKVVVYNVWGSWCAPCRKEAPVLRKVSEETRGQGVRFVGIDVKDNDGPAIAFERSFDITYPSIRTADSTKALLAFGTILPPSAVPSTLVIDRQGRIAARVIGAATYATLTALIDDVLEESDE